MEELDSDNNSHDSRTTYRSQESSTLPPSLTSLSFGNNFNQPINNLPNTITNLSFGRNFNQPISNLPS